MAGVQSIERAFLLLRALALSPGGVTELADRVDLPKSTVARLLSALETEGAVEKLEDGSEYRLGTGLETISGSATGRGLTATARPFLVDLSAQLGESSGLDVYEDGWIQFIDQVEAENDVQVRDWTGEWGRAHTLPAGLVILAHLGENVVQACIAEGLEALTSNTETDEAALRERIGQARSVGYAWGFEEFAEGINSVAAPVIGPDGVVAALRVHGPTYRFPDPNMVHDIGLIVSAAADGLSALLQS